MEADWDEVALIVHPPPAPATVAPPSPVSTLAFDAQQELLWTGNDYGRAASFYGADLSKYTSYKGHVEAGPSVRQILPCEKGILSLAGRSIHLASRRGMTIWHLTNDAFEALRCMSFTVKGVHEIIAAGEQGTMFKIDIEKGTILETLPTPHRDKGYFLMKRSGLYICAATTTGDIHILDPKTLALVKDLQTNNVAINDMDAKSDFLVTCGWSLSHRQYPMLDPMAAVYDLKTFLPLPPIGFPTGAAFVRMHPRMSTTGIVASQSGQIQVVDIMNPNTSNIKQINLYDCQLTALEMAPSGEAIVLTDSRCHIHLWGSPSKIQFSEYSNATEFPDQVPAPPELDWAPGTPLNMIGMPYYRETLFSAWPTHLVFDVGAPPTAIDPDIMANLKRTEIGGYAPNPRKTRRNQAEDSRRNQSAKDMAFAAPKFLSEKARDSKGEDEHRRMSDAIEALRDLDVGAIGLRKDVPLMYRNVEIRYSKFGVDDFDFKYYNKTQFSGLETHIANSYANPLLQLYRFTPILRNLALHHAATSCLFELCLLCELGFLIDMLEKAAGQNCQATNFLKNFSNQSNASSFGLLEEHATSTPLTAMIQSANRFFLDKFSQDFRRMPPQSSLLEQAVSTRSTNVIRCANCANEDHRIDQVAVHELIYPPRMPNRAVRGSMQQQQQQQQQRHSFSQTLKGSVERQVQTKAWCNRCKRYQQLITRKVIQEIPPVLFINAAIHSQDAKQLWATEGWLPREIGVIVDGGQFFCYEGDDLKFHQSRKSGYNMTVYELVGVVADVNSGENQKPHLVSLVNVAPSSRNAEDHDQWHLFNDFLVRPTPAEEALHFNAVWKLPSVLAYQMKEYSHHIDDAWKAQLDTNILFFRGSSRHTNEDPAAFKLLNPQTEAPKPDTPVAIDAEFVSLQREEIEVKADGTRETIRPTRLGLARVSVLRGSGPDEAVTFIDDYIATADPVIDYLTEFSGIYPGDLDPAMSRHVLCSLKVAYKKLWLLLNLGCVFVGHGLLKDFRTINIQVPKAQVVDTVDLFFIKSRQRKLNLRFLAWLLLDEEIQREEHDSVEDARTALRLWRKWLEYDDAGILENRLEWIYARGREVGYKAPGAAAKGTAGAAVLGSGTPEPAGEGRVTPARKAGGWRGSRDGGRVLGGPPMR